MVISQTKYILIVDDSLDQQALLKLVLEKNGYKIECRSNGEEALELLHSGLKMPDTILLDLNMPGMGGLGFRQVQKQDPLLRNIPVIIMSGVDDLKNSQQDTNLNILQKPFSILNLIDIVERNSDLH